MDKQLILSATQSKLIIKRLAFEIYENNYQEKEILLAGIYDKGYSLAEIFTKELQSIAPKLSVTLVKVELDKFSPTQSEIKLNVEASILRDKSIILVDDVLNSGRTLVYSLHPFLRTEIKRIQVAVLVDRGYKSFPIAPDFTGYALSTTMKEHVEVVFENGETLVYLA